MGPDHFRARPKHQVKGVAQNDFRTDFMDIPGQHTLDGAIGANGHERRGFNGTPGKRQPATTSTPVLTQFFERHETGLCHKPSPAVSLPVSSDSEADPSNMPRLGSCPAINMASP